MGARLTRAAAGVALWALLLPAAACAQADVAVPAACTDAVNAGFARLFADGRRTEVDNVMVCGTTVARSRTQFGSRVDHQVLPLRVNLPGVGARLVEVVTNDALDGVVSAPAHAVVFAYGQFYYDGPGRYRAGIHDVHCSTHRGADNGWVVVNGSRFPQRACARFR